jgi:hypothetical protein
VRAADPRCSAPAIAAGLGCLDASLEALQAAVAVMRVASPAALEQAPSAGVHIDGRRSRSEPPWTGSPATSRRAQASCAAVRELVGPALAGR